MYAAPASPQTRQRLCDEAVDCAAVGTVAVTGVGPVGRTHQRLVGSTDTTAVSIQALADRFLVGQANEA